MTHLTKTWKYAKFGFEIAAGAASGVDITIDNIKTTDQIVFCIESHVAAHDTKNQTDNTTITADGIINIADDTSGGNVTVLFISSDQ